MKKNYITPVLEVYDFQHIAPLMVMSYGGEANAPEMPIMMDEESFQEDVMKEITGFPF